ncbi:MAG: hypothetical protein IJT59_05025 [Desulfovibrionaceae bacterium]|nr:hypothetical protein [Desulfovibrionaceae bacterium]
MDVNLWSNLIYPLLRLLCGLAIGIFIANLLESLNWTYFLQRLSTPLAKSANLGPCAATAFSLAFISPNQANAYLSEQYAAQKISWPELVIANLFNSLPAYLAHLPTLFLLIFPVIGASAAIYVGLCLLSALLRTLLTLTGSRLFLPNSSLKWETEQKNLSKIGFGLACQKAWQRFCRRLPKLLIYTVPIYIIIYLLQINGVFAAANQWLTEQNFFKTFFSPEACSIIFLHLLAELGSALGAAGALLSTQSLSTQEVIFALLIGNILSTPIRAIRHQLPAYAGFYTPSVGLQLIVINQLLRASSLLLLTVLYYLLTY